MRAAVEKAALTSVKFLSSGQISALRNAARHQQAKALA
jgi:hypothetical protein